MIEDITVTGKKKSPFPLEKSIRCARDKEAPEESIKITVGNFRIRRAVV